MRTWKREMRLLTALLLTAAMIILPVLADDSGVGVSWSFSEADGALIISGEGAMADYTEEDGAPWSGLEVRSVTVEEGVTYIGENAFRELTLSLAALPVSLTGVGPQAFWGCELAEARFAGNLKQWRENVTVGVGNAALTDVIGMERDVAYAGEGLSLANGILDCRLSSIPEDFRAEYGYYVREIRFRDIELIDYAGCGTYYGNNYFPNLEQVLIGEGVTEIGMYAFHGCCSLTGVTFPESLREIGDYAFLNCAGLTEILIPEGTTLIGDQVFSGCTGLTGISLPDSLTQIGDYVFLNCAGLTEILIPDGVTHIGNGAFFGCTSLTGMELPKSVTWLGGAAFQGCSGLRGSLVVPEGVTSIGANTFNGCSGLTGVTLPESVTSIEMWAFYGSGITRIKLPAAVTEVQEHALENCIALTDVMLPSVLTEIREMAFHNCSALTDVYYGGTEDMWCAINIGGSNEALEAAEFHYGEHDPVITGQPESRSVRIGETAVFSVKVSGKRLTYRWYYRTQPEGEWIAASAASARTADYRIIAKAKHDGYQYFCRVTDGFTTLDSAVVTLTVESYIAPEILAEPADLSIQAGKKASFSVWAAGEGLRYQWYYRTGPEGEWRAASAASARTATYRNTAKTKHNGYQYFCRVTDGITTLDSAVVTLTVRTDTALRILAGPDDVRVEVGETAAFAVFAYGNDLRYQWYYRTEENGEWTPVSAKSGQTAIYSLTVKVRHDGYQYLCMVSDGTESRISAIATLTVER